jgi:predicted nucleic acid-binding protein
MSRAVIVDTSAIVAVFDEAHPEHTGIARVVTDTSRLLVVSPMIVAEADYMLASRLATDAALRFAADVASEAYELAEWTAADHAVALDICTRHGDGNDYLGVADASNVVLADRYRTADILTLDQRHFRVLRPLWGADHFTLLPYDA